MASNVFRARCELFRATNRANANPRTLPTNAAVTNLPRGKSIRLKEQRGARTDEGPEPPPYFGAATKLTQHAGAAPLGSQTEIKDLGAAKHHLNPPRAGIGLAILQAAGAFAPGTYI